MRGVWLALLAVHVPILVTLTMDVLAGAAPPERVASWLGLLAATAAFGVLACRGFARCLGSPRHSFWLLCLATAIVHRGAIGFGPGEPMLPAALVATTVVVGERLWRPGRRFLRMLGSTLAASARRPARGGVVERLEHEPRRARRARVAAACGPRAPPRAAVPA